MSCDDCFKGARHEGEPEGHFETIGGINCYVATSEGEHNKNAVVLFLTDVFGIQFLNNQLLISDLAKNGFKTVAPDLFNGDPAPAIVRDGKLATSPDWNREAWLAAHKFEDIHPMVEKVIKALQDTGVSKFGANGYCFGARSSFDLAFDNAVSVVVVSHPSRLTVPNDFERYKSTSKAPLLINSCTIDRAFDHDAQKGADAIMGDGQFQPGYVREYFEGCTHGFAVRADLDDPKAIAGKQGAFKATVQFFQIYL